MRRVLGLIVGVLLMGSAAAQQVAPDVFVKGVISDVINIAGNDREIQNGDTAKAIQLVESKVLPAFDFKRMTALAVGKAWRGATADQQSSLINEFRRMMVNTYSNALTAFKNQTIKFKPVKVVGDETDVTVRTEIRQPGARSTSIDYALEKQDASWKVYDVTVAGISLVTSFRDQFAEEIHNGGIDGLIKTLQAKNSARAAIIAKPQPKS